MDARCELFDLLDGFDLPLNNLRAGRVKRFIPDFELVAVTLSLSKGAIFAQRFEQCVALTERLVVITEHARICWDSLRQCEVEIASAFLGTIFNDARHLRYKDDGVKVTNDLVHLFLHAIEQNFFAQALTIDAVGRGQARFEFMFLFVAFILGDQTCTAKEFFASTKLTNWRSVFV